MQAHSSKLSLVLKSLVAILAGALASTLASTLIFTTILVWAPGEIPGAPAGPNPFLPYILPAAALFLLIAFIIIAVYAFIVGVPLALVFISARLIRWWTCLLGGFLLGLLPAVVFVRDFLEALLLGGGLGAIGGLTTWLVWSFLTWPPRAATSHMPDGQVADPPASA